MSEYLSREVDQYTRELNKRLLDVVSLLINQYGDYDSASEFIDQIAAYVENEMFGAAQHQLDRAERDPVGYFDLPHPTYEKEVLPEDDEPFTDEQQYGGRAKLFWFG